MKYELYIDAFFLLNFFMDTLLLFLIRKLLNCTVTHLRMLLGGALGAAGACLVTIMPGIPVWVKLFAGYGIISMGMIRISFPGLHFGAVCRAGIYLYGLAFLLGGVLEFLWVQIPVFRKHGMGILGICTAGMLVYALVGFLYARRQERKSGLLTVRIVWRDKAVMLRALLDTGNGLYEPVGGKPVSVVERRALEEIFQRGRPGIFRAIPFHSIGTSHGIMEGYEVTELVIYEENKKIRIEKPMIASFDGMLSAKAAYQMILHPALIEEGRLVS